MKMSNANEKKWIKSQCFLEYVRGQVISCGSGCFQTSDGSQWLGKPSAESLANARYICLAVDAPVKLQRLAVAFLADSGVDMRTVSVSNVRSI